MSEETAPVTDTTTPATETPAEPPPPAAIAPSNLERAKKAAQAARDGAARMQQQTRDIEQLRAEKEQLSAEREQLRKAAGEAEEFRRMMKEDPIALARAHGYTDEQIAEQLLKQGTPEAKVDQSLLAMKRELEEMKAERAAERAERQRQMQAESRAKFEQTFMETCQNEELYPNLSKQPAVVTLRAAKEIAREFFERSKQIPSDDEILEYLESQYAPKDPEKKPPPPAGDAKKKAAPSQTLTNELASERTSDPIDWDKLTDTEQKKLMADMLRKAATKT